MRLRTGVVALGISAVVACAHAPRRTSVYPAGPGLLEERPAQASGTYRVVGWVLSDQTGQPLGEALVLVDGTAISTRTDAYGRYLLADVPGNRNAILVRAVGYQTERREFIRKALAGLWICAGECKATFTDTLNFWLHQRP